MALLDSMGNFHAVLSEPSIILGLFQDLHHSCARILQGCMRGTGLGKTIHRGSKKASVAKTDFPIAAEGIRISMFYRVISRQHALAVMAGLVPAVHALTRVKTWLALTGTAMTTERGRLNEARCDDAAWLGADCVNAHKPRAAMTVAGAAVGVERRGSPEQVRG
jgi:hypothetical protein